MRFLIAGLGSVGRRHLHNLIALGQRDIVLLRSGHGTLPSGDLTGFPVEHDLSHALGRGPDAVIVATPTARHLAVAIPAARAGCHLLLEKPVSHDLSQIDELRSAVAAGGGNVLVGFQFRFHPLLRQLRERLQAGRVGVPQWALAHWGEYLPDWHPWEDYRRGYAARRDLGGGVLLTLSHPLDYLVWLFGPLACDAARVRNLGHLQLDVEDQADLLLHGGDGLTAAVHLDYYQRPTQHWVAVGGGKRSLRLDFTQGRLDEYDGGSATSVSVPVGFERNDMFLAEMEHFLRVCRGEEASACGLEEGLISLALAMQGKALDPTPSESH